MGLYSLQTYAFRLLSDDVFYFHPRFNILVGANGTGKTSVIEAIYFLLNARSFRTADLHVIGLNGAHEWMTCAQLYSGLEIKIQKTVSGMSVLLNNNRCSRRSDIVKTIPSQLIYSDVFNIMDAGPTIRREMLDWGMFHVEHTYHDLWTAFRKVLKHRNVLLKRNASKHEFIPWDKQFIELSEALTALRNQYCQQWFERFDDIRPILTDSHCRLLFYKGWDKFNQGESLASVLENTFESDKFKQYTQFGAHQCDIVLTSETMKSKHYLSRGQQKMVLMALKLAQSSLLNKPSIYLMDDVISELDEAHLVRFFSILETIPGQFFFTTLSTADFMTTLFFNQSHFFYMNDGQFILNSSN